MSRRNKVNPDHYTIAGRLAPDDLARERRKQAEHMTGGSRGRQRAPLPPWMANDASADTPNAGDDTEKGQEADAAVKTADDETVEAARPPQAAAKPKSQAAARATRSAKSQPRTTPKRTGKASARKTASRTTVKATPPKRGAAKTAKSAKTARTAKSAKSARTVKTVKKAKKAKKR